MRLVGQGLFQILLVEGVHLGILMGEAELAALVQLPEHRAAEGGHLQAVVDGLAAAARAAAGAGHDLHKVVCHFSGLNGLHELTGVGQAVGHGHPDGACTGNVEGGFLPAVHAADREEGIGVGVLTGDQEIGAAQRRVHDAAGGAEDHRRAGAGAQGEVKLLLGKLRDVHMVAL